MSERFEIANDLLSFLSDNDLCQVYGDVSKTTAGSKNIPVYVVSFSKRSNLDAEIIVFGKKFFQLFFQTRYLDFPNKESLVFKNIDDLKGFIKEGFVNLNAEKAYEYTAGE